ncbi:MAG: hypothetical protein M1834_005987 [Cirrosporium novae-zelandiae]|nr:MAG: hypothetical protein M1834_005987 [Cirrosporium novae-zelandiae]
MLVEEMPGIQNNMSRQPNQSSQELLKTNSQYQNEPTGNYASDNERADASPRGRKRRRVALACDRCRIKKSRVRSLSDCLTRTD